MPTERFEYRVRWKREGRGPTTAIRQSLESAWRKATGILALEAIKSDTSFHAMPDLEQGPTIEARPVGAWEPMGRQVTEVSEYAKERMAEWAKYTNPRQPVGADDAPF